MSSAVVTLRFPNGESEFRSTTDPPKSGDLMKCRGGRWIVANVVAAKDGSAVVTLTPEARLGRGTRHAARPDDPA